MFTSFQVQIPQHESIWVENSDRAGITLDSETSIISFDYANERNMVFRNIFNPETGGDLFPEVGNSYQFQTISLPTVWSIGVVVKTGNDC